MLGVALLSLVRGLESFEVELVVCKPTGISVYSTRIYNLFHDQPPQLGEATALGFVFLVLMLLLAVFYLRAIPHRPGSSQLFETAASHAPGLTDACSGSVRTCPRE